MARLEFPLYHGTSTLFLESIARHGIGGWDPIKEWRVLECLHRLIPIAEKHRQRSTEIMKLLGTIEPMAKQLNAALNFQHGSVYVSPSRFTAVRYATGKKKGSELISYTAMMLEELARYDLKEVNQGLYQEFPQIFRLLNIDAAPVLIQLDGLEAASLLSEKGEAPDGNLAHIYGLQKRMPDSWERISQQLNFRMTKVVPTKDLQISLIMVREWQQHRIDYGLARIDLVSSSEA